MPIMFNADEVFQMAEEIEVSGARFYRKAAEHAPEGARRMLEGLARMEDAHRKMFVRMHERFKSRVETPPLYDPEGEAARYLQAFADRRIFNVQGDPSRSLTGKEELGEVLTTALSLEKDSIVFYSGIRELVPPGPGRDEVEQIIRQEMGHAAMLARELQTASK